jgi:Flp pilus assembly protein TadB
MEASTYLPVAAGLILGGGGSVWFIVRSRALSDLGKDGPRRFALRSVLVIYIIVTCFCLIISIAIGEVGLILTSGIMVLIAAAGLVRVWLGDPNRNDQMGSS